VAPRPIQGGKTWKGLRIEKIPPLAMMAHSKVKNRECASKNSSGRGTLSGPLYARKGVGANNVDPDYASTSRIPNNLRRIYLSSSLKKPVHKYVKGILVLVTCQKSPKKPMEQQKKNLNKCKKTTKYRMGQRTLFGAFINNSFKKMYSSNIVERTFSAPQNIANKPVRSCSTSVYTYTARASKPPPPAQPAWGGGGEGPGMPGVQSVERKPLRRQHIQLPTVNTECKTTMRHKPNALSSNLAVLQIVTLYSPTFMTQSNLITLSAGSTVNLHLHSGRAR